MPQDPIQEGRPTLTSAGPQTQSPFAKNPVLANELLQLRKPTGFWKRLLRSIFNSPHPPLSQAAFVAAQAEHGGIINRPGHNSQAGNADRARQLARAGQHLDKIVGAVTAKKESNTSPAAPISASTCYWVHSRPRPEREERSWRDAISPLPTSAIVNHSSRASLERAKTPQWPISPKPQRRLR